MDRWLDLLSHEWQRTRPPVLYHYTDAFGAQGIISSNCLWATATQFSNDLSEIEYAAALGLDTIKAAWRGKKKISSWERVLVEHLVQLFETPLHAFGQPFIVSFCENGDLLSQWRAYGSASGFSMAFSPLYRQDAVTLISKGGFRTKLNQVIYDEEEQRQRLRHILRRLVELVDGFSFATTSSKGKSAHVELSVLLVLEMTDWACAVKHRAFSEEKEWRIVTYPQGATLVGTKSPNYESILVRPTSRLLLPYMILEPPTGKLLPLLEVRCGPSQFQEQSARAMGILVGGKGYRDVAITLSRIPLRT